MARRESPLRMMLNAASDGDGREPHPLSAEAQVANLEAAWDHYQRAKQFRPGQKYRERPGLNMFKDDPVLLFVRQLDARDPVDCALAEDAISRMMCAKLDCVVARCRDDGGIIFFVLDSDVLEPLAAREKCA